MDAIGRVVSRGSGAREMIGCRGHPDAEGVSPDVTCFEAIVTVSLPRRTPSFLRVIADNFGAQLLA